MKPMDINQDFSPKMELLIAQVEDTLQPSFDLMSLKIAIREFIQEIYNREVVTGVTPKITESKAKFNRMLDICERLDKVANQNNTFQLVVKHSQIELHNAQMEILRLEKIIEANQKAFDNE